MSIESLQSRIEALRERTIALSRKNGRAALYDYQALIESLEEMAALAEKELSNTWVEIEPELKSHQPDSEYTGRKYAKNLLAAEMEQQAVITQLSQHALLSVNLQELLNEACADIARTLSVDFCNVLEFISEKHQVLFRASAGWEESMLRSYVDLEPDSQFLYVLSENQPIRIIELSKETRFRASKILVEHEIVSGISVVISVRSRIFGLLETYSTKRRVFTEDDVRFLQGVAHVLAAAIQHREVEDALRLSRNQLSVILGGISDGITAQARNGRIIYANDAAARLIGYENASELMTTPLDQITSKFKIFDEFGMPMSSDQLPGRVAMRGETPLPMAVRFKVLKTGEERWSLVKAQAVTNEANEVMMVVNIFHDITDLKRAELRQRLLAETSKAMAKELDYKARLNELANLVVPSLADWCAIDLLDENNILQRVAVAHPDPQMVEWAHELHERYPPDPNSNTGAYKVVRSNQAEYVPVITEQMIETVESADARDLLRKLKISSVIIVPLFARGHSLGTLSLIWAESDHFYTADDLALTEELARRAALALDNARLFSEAQRLNAELEERVLKRTHQLQRTNLRLSQEVEDRKLAEEKYRELSIDLEERVIERTRQLEHANQNLQREVFERELADNALRSSLQKMSELYEISRTMGIVNTPDELLQVLLSSSLLESAIRASVAIFDQIWRKDGPAPASCMILTAWNKQPGILLHIGQKMTLMEYGLIEPYSRLEPLIIADIQSDSRVSETMRQRLMNIGVVGSILFPLIAGGEWYGMLSLHFNRTAAINANDIRHLQGLVDEAAMGIHNFILFRTEAQARQEAEAANNLKLKFLAMISHELRTPLTSIKGFSTTLLADDVEWKPENQRDFIETINVEADKLSDLIEQLLDLSRLEAGTMRINPQPVEWSQIVLTSMAQLNALAINHHLVINETQPDLPALNVDVTRVSQVITNLVSNSVKYSSRNTTITISTEKLSNHFIKVSVLDEGMGIPPESRSRVFESFQQLEHERRSTQGAGLGLAICRGLIEAHGGRIWVDNHTGDGTTISFTLPIADE
jgi:PAS domain S-box-containing protein